MKKIIHKAIIRLGIEEFFVRLRRKASFIRKFVPVSIRHKFVSVGRFVPHSSSFPKDDSYLLTRDDTTFRINRSDYVQWRIFYGVRDNALKLAKEALESDSVGLDIGANDRLRHSPPSESGQTQLVPGCLIADAPGIETDDAEVTALTSRTETGHVSDVHPSLAGRLDLKLENLSPQRAGRRERAGCRCRVLDQGCVGRPAGQRSYAGTH